MSHSLRRSLPYVLIVVCFTVLSFAAQWSTFVSLQSTVAGSMHWFELESNGICKPSPVNRIARPQVCLGFEQSPRLIAQR